MHFEVKKVMTKLETKQTFLEAEHLKFDYRMKSLQHQSSGIIMEHIHTYIYIYSICVNFKTHQCHPLQRHQLTYHIYLLGEPQSHGQVTFDSQLCPTRIRAKSQKFFKWFRMKLQVLLSLKSLKGEDSQNPSYLTIQ